jgi:hypothetical protein
LAMAVALRCVTASTVAAAGRWSVRLRNRPIHEWVPHVAPVGNPCVTVYASETEMLNAARLL